MKYLEAKKTANAMKELFNGGDGSLKPFAEELTRRFEEHENDRLEKQRKFLIWIKETF